MRFLLLCPAALLLLAAPAISVSSDSNSTEQIVSKPTTVPDNSTSPGSHESDAEGVPPSTYESISLEVKKLRKQVAEAQAEHNALREEYSVLHITSESVQFKVERLRRKQQELVEELMSVQEKLKEAQDELNTEASQEVKCKPSESELLKLIEEETAKQVVLRKVEIKRSYERKYENLIKDLRLKIRRELQLLTDSSNTPINDP